MIIVLQIRNLFFLSSNSLVIALKKNTLSIFTTPLLFTNHVTIVKALHGTSIYAIQIVHKQQFYFNY